MLVLSGADSEISQFSFNIANGTTVRLASASINLVFLVTDGLVKIYLKNMGKKKNKHRKFALLATSKLNNRKKIMSKALIDSDISHEEFQTVIKPKYLTLQVLSGSFQYKNHRD